MDDIDKSTLATISKYIVTWSDPYSLLTGKVKGGKSVPLSYTHLYITS
jgi:hypothetical protein